MPRRHNLPPTIANLHKSSYDKQKFKPKPVRASEARVKETVGELILTAHPNTFNLLKKMCEK